MKILHIVGNRPQFIKLSPFLKATYRYSDILNVIVHSGQHYDFNISDVFFTKLKLPKPNYYLGIDSGFQGEQTAKMLSGIEKVLLKEKPHLVLVYGDTNSTLAGALAAVKLHIPVAHVEAGLRSFNREMPEEVNRVLTDHSSTILFAPTKAAVENLKHEGITKNVYNVGDVMFDIALRISRNINERQILNKYNLTPQKYILTTIHRADNTDIRENLENILEALKEISNNYKIFFPVHPRTKNAMEKFNLLNDIPENLVLNEPVSYKEMIALEKNARLIITDSGGLQKEAYFFKVPCITVRKETEWVELVDAGWNKLAGTHKDKILEIVFEELRKKRLPKWEDFYGGGKASERIVRILKNEEM